MEPKAHWEKIYQTKAPNGVSWYQERPSQSLRFIHSTGLNREAVIIDVGGGASALVDHLLAEKYSHITVLDISAEALQKAKDRLGNKASAVTWMNADITQAALPKSAYDLWHDRAVFHFLTQAGDRMRYLDVLNKAVRPGGHVIMATFALDGPPKCSGLEVVRYSRQTLSLQLGEDFTLMASVEESHQTPFATTQKFVYCHFQKKP